MNTIVTKGLGIVQQLVTQGYGFSVTVISDSGNEYQFGGVRKVYGKEGFQYLKDMLDGIIQTESIVLGGKKVHLLVEVKLMAPRISVEDPIVGYKERTITISVTN